MTRLAYAYMYVRVTYARHGHAYTHVSKNYICLELYLPFCLVLAVFVPSVPSVPSVPGVLFAYMLDLSPM